jgi:hypothetical protein
MQDTGAEKKIKGKPAMGRWRVLRWMIGFLVFPVIVIFVWLILSPTILPNGQITQKKLDSGYLPTAAYLLDNPLPTPQGFPVSLSVEQNSSEWSVDYFCLHGFVPRDTGVKVMEFNQYRVIGSSQRSIINGLAGDDSGYILSRCIEGAVETGLHLLSVEMTSDSWAETYSYTWAVEITNDGYNYLPDYLLRNLAKQ